MYLVMPSLSGLGLYKALVLLLNLNVTKASFFNPNMLNSPVDKVVMSRSVT